MGTIIFLAVLVWIIVHFVRKGNKHEAPDQPSATPSGETPDECLVSEVEEDLRKDPNRFKADPETYVKCKFGFLKMYSKLLSSIDWDVTTSINPLSWTDFNIAAKARKWSERGVYHGEEYCALMNHTLDAETKDKMAYLHMMRALVARLDNDHEKAYDHNCMRLRYENPDIITEEVIGGMLADARNAGGDSKTFDMLTIFSDLAQEDPRWDTLTPKIRRVVGTD
ncbi:MAG: hypothetical protein WCO18_00915 [bacterium]